MKIGSVAVGDQLEMAILDGVSWLEWKTWEFVIAGIGYVDPALEGSQYSVRPYRSQGGVPETLPKPGLWPYVLAWQPDLSSWISITSWKLHHPRLSQQQLAWWTTQGASPSRGKEVRVKAMSIRPLQVPGKGTGTVSVAREICHLEKHKFMPKNKINIWKALFLPFTCGRREPRAFSGLNESEIIK